MLTRVLSVWCSKCRQSVLEWCSGKSQQAEETAQEASAVTGLTLDPLDVVDSNGTISFVEYLSIWALPLVTSLRSSS